MSAVEKPDGVSDTEWAEAMAIYKARQQADAESLKPSERGPITLWTLVKWWFAFGIIVSAIRVLVEFVYKVL